MTLPVLMVVDDDPASLGALDGTLRRRYGSDYLIISETAPAAATGRLRELRTVGHPVALLMAASAMTAMSPAEFLAQARVIEPGAKRALVVQLAGRATPSVQFPIALLRDRHAARPVLQAMALGLVDAYLPVPVAERDEVFHRAVSELLAEWAQGAVPAVPAMRIIAPGRSARAQELRDALTRSGVPYVFNDAESADGNWWLRHVGQDGSGFPVLVMYTGQVLVDPPNDQAAAAFGLADLPAEMVDLAIVGAGPAGISAAVYTASEGLSTLLLGYRGLGGQAGSSSLIRNYMGFPRGISGANLTIRAFEQAWSFGAILSLPGPVTGLWPKAGGFTLATARGKHGRARSVLIATGMSYRRLEAPGLGSLLGAGVFYGAATSEARAFAGEHVFIAGGANSAGQTAVNFARYARQVTIVVRSESLAARMSRYLIDEIGATANIDVRTSTHVVAAKGVGKLEALTLTNTTTGSVETVPAAALIVLIGAVPRAGWLPPQICRDEHGFVVTGSDIPDDQDPACWTLSRPPLSMETSLPGVFAAGDVRHGSVKRCASAVGEGSVAAAQVGTYLQEHARQP